MKNLETQLEFEFMNEMRAKKRKEDKELAKTIGYIFGGYFSLIGIGILTDYISKHPEIYQNICDWLSK